VRVDAWSMRLMPAGRLVYFRVARRAPVRDARFAFFAAMSCSGTLAIAA